MYETMVGGIPLVTTKRHLLDLYGVTPGRGVWYDSNGGYLPPVQLEDTWLYFPWTIVSSERQPNYPVKMLKGKNRGLLCKVFVPFPTSHSVVEE